MNVREDHLALNPGRPISPESVIGALRYVSGYDGRVTAEDATADIWGKALIGLGEDLVKDIIVNYYAGHDPRQPDRQKISPGWIKAEAKSRRERVQNLARLEKPYQRKGSRMPAHVLHKLQQRGYLTDRDPADYREE